MWQEDPYTTSYWFFTTVSLYLINVVWHVRRYCFISLIVLGENISRHSKGILQKFLFICLNLMGGKKCHCPAFLVALTQTQMTLTSHLDLGTLVCLCSQWLYFKMKKIRVLTTMHFSQVSVKFSDDVCQNRFF